MMMRARCCALGLLAFAFGAQGVPAASGDEPICQGEDSSMLQIKPCSHHKPKPKPAPRCGPKHPFIFDTDANYDDSLAMLYLANSQNLDWKAITVEADGMATPHGGPTNMAALAKMLALGDVPVAFGHQASLSPIATMPLQWRVEVDEFFEKMFPGGPNGTVLEPTDAEVSALSAPELITKVLKESECPVVILTLGPVTNLAVALDADPSIAENIHSLYMMGSAYGAPGTNNVYNFQMVYNDAVGSCTEDGGQTFTGLSPVLDVGDGQMHLVRPGCRGVDMSKHGDTEWNTFMDVLAWRKVYSYMKDSPAQTVVLATNATLSLSVELDEMERFAEMLADDRLRIFCIELAKAFLAGGGEAKWWDAQLAVVMDETLSGSPLGVCSNYAYQKRTTVSLIWRSLLKDDELNPYGSVYDDLEADAPLINYCLDGDVDMMWKVYWPQVNMTGQ